MVSGVRKRGAVGGLALRLGNVVVFADRAGVVVEVGLKTLVQGFGDVQPILKKDQKGLDLYITVILLFQNRVSSNESI